MKQLANALFAVVCLGCLLLTPLMPGLSVVPLAGAIVAPDMTDAPVDPTL
jgi:membrane protein DedA with SNARE-associated domain